VGSGGEPAGGGRERGEGEGGRLVAEERADVALHRCGVGVATLAVPGEGAIDDEGEVLGEVGGDGAKGGRGLGGDLEEQLELGVGEVDVAPGEGAKEGSADGVEVGAAVEVAEAHDLLGGHEGGGPEDGAGLGGDPAGRVAAAIADASDAKVEDLEAPIGEEKEVIGLEVPVDDPCRMGGDEDVEEAIGEAQQGVDGGAPLLVEEVLERVAFEELHDEERQALLGGIDVDDLDHTGVLDLVDGAPFELEPLAQVRVGGGLRVEDLEGDAAARGVDGGVDRGHPASPKEALDRPLAMEDRADPVEVRFGHGKSGAILAGPGGRWAASTWSTAPARGPGPG
jgi:hypothetical protein